MVDSPFPYIVHEWCDGFANAVSKMGAIYAGPLFTIAATDAINSNSGYFNAHHPLHREDCVLVRSDNVPRPSVADRETHHLSEPRTNLMRNLQGLTLNLPPLIQVLQSKWRYISTVPQQCTSQSSFPRDRKSVV